MIIRFAKRSLKVGFAFLSVLVIGNLLHFKGKTLSEQVRIGMVEAQRSELARKLRGWTNELVDDSRSSSSAPERDGDEDAIAQESAPRARGKASAAGHREEIPATERQKLRALIRELNH